MPAPLSFTPSGRVFPPDAGERVRRRRVLFVPGYDPEARTRYRMLFVRELIRYAKRFGLERREISAVESLPALPGQGWRVRVGKDDWQTETRVEVLLWDDLVRRDFARPVLLGIALLYCGIAASLVTGVMRRFFRLNWKFGGVIVYPAVMTALALALSLGIGAAVAGLLSGPWPVPGWGRAALLLGAAGLVFCALYPLGQRWFVWHLTHDWVFNWQHGMGWRPDHEARSERFADHLVAAVGEGGCDEILVVGHSSGASVALDLFCRALERLPAGQEDRPRLALLTLGSCVPLVALNPSARTFRRRIAALCRRPDVLWAEYQAPQDWLNFAGFNPLRDLGLGVPEEDAANPVIRSTRFKDIVAEATYEAIAFRPFRMHFQFLMANDRPGDYDYLSVLTGPLSLLARVGLPEGTPARLAGVGCPAGPLSAAELARAERDRVSASSET